MNWYFATAAILAVAIGLVHSILGERLIFRRLRVAGVVPTRGGLILRESHVRILWASWHVVTVLGICLAAALLWLAMPASDPATKSPLVWAIVASMLGSSALVLIGTRGRHPGWVGLLGVAVLAAMGA